MANKYEIAVQRTHNGKKKRENYLFSATGITDAEAKMVAYFEENEVKAYDLKTVRIFKVDQILYENESEWTEDHQWFKVVLQSGDLKLTYLVQSKKIEHAIKKIKLAPQEAILGITPKAYTHVDA
jgi:ADP-ribosylglycohydrolase